MRLIILAMVLGLSTFSPAWADCKDEIEEVDEDIREHRDEYAAGAIAEARKHLSSARLHIRDRSVDCRNDVRQARQALRQGKK